MGNILQRHGFAPAPKAADIHNLKRLIAAHLAVLSGVDIFTFEVLT
jgi:hypothetical protein